MVLFASWKCIYSGLNIGLTERAPNEIQAEWDRLLKQVFHIVPEEEAFEWDAFAIEEEEEEEETS